MSVGVTPTFIEGTPARNVAGSARAGLCGAAGKAHRADSGRWGQWHSQFQQRQVSMKRLGVKLEGDGRVSVGPMGHAKSSQGRAHLR